MMPPENTPVPADLGEAMLRHRQLAPSSEDVGQYFGNRLNAHEAVQNGKISLSFRSSSLAYPVTTPFDAPHSSRRRGGRSCWLWLLLQSRVRPIQWADGADHKALSTLLRGDGDTVGHRTDQDIGQGTPHFTGCGIGIVCGVEFQPGVLGILFQPTLALEAAICSLTNQLNQIHHLVFMRCFDALKPGWSVVPVDVYAIQKQEARMTIAETLSQKG
jgi:hypothetical protein